MGDRTSRLTSEAPGWVSLTAGGLARLLAVTIVNPLELIRTKMQSQKMPWSDVTKCLSQLVRSQGVRGLWNGYTATLLSSRSNTTIARELVSQHGARALLSGLT